MHTTPPCHTKLPTEAGITYREIALLSASFRLIYRLLGRSRISQHHRDSIFAGQYVPDGHPGRRPWEIYRGEDPLSMANIHSDGFEWSSSVQEREYNTGSSS
jgi:hypothetical protein